jgi:4-hydroxyacetophenone monooxygenase
MSQEMLDSALAEAHLPALLMSVVHITGDASVLDGFPQPVYDPFGDSRTAGWAPEVQDKARSIARAALTKYLAGDKKLPAPPSHDTVTKMMTFVAGAELPPHYVPFLLEELSIEGVDPKYPQWTDPKVAARKEAMKIVIVGAGMSGLLAAIRLKQAGVAFSIIEKNKDVGGTWFENSYPGCRVDTQNHLYSYSFEPNHEWPLHYSTQNILHSYFQRITNKHGLRQNIRFETQVEEARFDEKTAKWTVTVKDASGKTDRIVADAVISAVGQLNQPRFPDIKGVGAFKGPAFHSAQWDHSVDLKGKTVACIGTGASAFQFVPEIAKDVKKLFVFQRTPPWLAPTPDYHDTVGAGKKWLLEHVPFYDKWYRFFLFWLMTDGVYESVKVDSTWNGGDQTISQANAELRAQLIEALKPQVAAKPELLDKIVPSYPFGGKRSLRDNGVWVGALARDNVELVTDPITEIDATGLNTKSGKHIDVDAIVYGTGFYASTFLRTFKIYGRDGVELHDKWAGDARAYLGMTTPGFPNFFMIYGPNTNIVVNGSIVFFSECSVRYILDCLKLLAETGAATMEPKQDVHDAFNDKVDAANQKMAWGVPQVSSWYKNAKGRVSQNWPFPLVDYWQATIHPNANDFTFEKKAS